MYQEQRVKTPSIFLNVHELAELLKVSRASIYRLVEHRSIPFHRLPRGLRFHKDDIERYLAKCRVEILDDEYERKKNT